MFTLVASGRLSVFSLSVFLLGLYRIQALRCKTMKIPTLICAAVLSPLFASVALGCCASTTEITITSLGVRASLKDGAMLDEFRFGPGPGNTINGIEITSGWIVADWLTPLAAPPASLVPADVLFQISIYPGEPREKHATYLVQYVYDPASGKGFIRLPASGEPHYSANSTLLWRGPKYEGKWFAATPAWIAAAESALRQALQDSLPK